jgi:transposase
MLINNNNFKVFLYLGRVDMRKAVNGLSLIVQDELKQNIFSENLFVFCSKNKSRIKILYWDKTGFCLWYKRLEKDKFKWPKSAEQAMSISKEELSWMLKGLDFKSAHKMLKYDEI